jgi:hypothetical protein
MADPELPNFESVWSQAAWYLHDAKARLVTMTEAARSLGHDGLAHNLAAVRMQIETAEVYLARTPR